MLIAASAEAGLKLRMDRVARFGVRRKRRNVVELQLSIQRGAADAQHPAGEFLVTAGLFEYAKDRHTFEVGEGGRRTGHV